MDEGDAGGAVPGARPRGGSGSGRSRAAERLRLAGVAAYRAGRVAEGLRCLEAALRASPDDAELLTNRGVLLRAAGRLDAAEACYRRALALAPGSPEAWYNLGNLFAARGAQAKAHRAFGRAVAASPGFADAWNALGVTCRALKDPRRARTCFGRALRAPRPCPAARRNLGELLAAEGRHEEALRCFRQAVRRAPRDVAAWVAAGRTLMALRRYRQAGAAFERAAQAAPRSLRAHLLWGQALERAHLADEATRAYEKALALDERSAEALLCLGRLLLHHAQSTERARGLFLRAVELHPGNVEAKAALGQTYVMEGKMEEAERWFRAVLAQAPEHSGAYRGLGAIKRARKEDYGDVAHMQGLLARDGLSTFQRADLEYALAEALEQRGAYEEAFDHAARANRLECELQPYDMRGPRGQVETSCRLFTKGFFEARAGWGDPTELPVFIVGMPRSGTTLTEQILASHPAVFGAGELFEVGNLRHRIQELVPTRKAFPASVGDLGRAAVTELARGHREFLASLAPAAARVTDKMPFNFFSLGLLALLYPRARFLNCRRNPLDNCVSCFFLRFGEHMGFSNDLTQVGTYYRLHERLMQHWREVLPVTILDVPYEGVVADQEGWTRRLLDFCGLPWDDRCLRFYETERPIKTASKWQVRQPMYQTSVGRWKRYRAHLGPLVEALGLTTTDLEGM